MKKVLALMLAVLMMSTLAFAATVKVTWSKDGTKGIVSSREQAHYGDKIIVDSGVIKSIFGSEYTKETDIKDVTTENYSVTSVKYNEGRSLIKSVAINDDDNQLEVKLSNNYDKTNSKSFEVEFTLKGKKSGKSDKPKDVDVKVVGRVTNEETPIKLAADDDDIDLGRPANNTVYTFDIEDGYATLNFETADDEVEVEGRVYDDDEYYLYSKLEADNDVLKAYADNDADITFLTFTGTPTFNSTMTVRFYKEEGTYFYINNDGNLVDINASRSSGSAMDLTSKVRWDDDEDCYILKTRTLGAYVMSDKPLKATTTADNVGATTNPDTGANDVVGIATALAAVALVSAAAVSLKK